MGLVLILVLVEHTLGVGALKNIGTLYFVLILVLVEHTLGVRCLHHHPACLRRLNPCFSGTYSRSTVRHCDSRRREES